MPLLKDPKIIRPLLKKMQSKNIAMPCFCAENTFTIEGILTGATAFADKVGLDSVPLYIAVTGNYHGRTQLANYTSQNSTEEGYYAFRNDIERLGRDGGPFPKVEIIPSLDHGQPGEDNFLFERGKDFWGCVMYDCSTSPLAENRKKTAEFVKQHRDNYLIEGCVDEIVESGETDKMQLTDPTGAKTFLEETNVDLMVVNLGTEHRATKSELKYHSDLARKISAIVGNNLVLHGTSSLTDMDLPKLADDGICKVNIWTILETDTTQKMVQDLIKNIGSILPKSTIDWLVEKQLLGKKAKEQTENNSPDLDYLTELYRRNQIKVPNIAKLVEGYLEFFNYRIAMVSRTKKPTV